jgi:hypothetical protein
MVIDATAYGLGSSENGARSPRCSAYPKGNGDTMHRVLPGLQRLFDKGELSAKRAVVLEARHQAPNGNAYGIVMDAARQLTKFFQTESSTGPAEEQGRFACTAAAGG